MTHDDLDRLGLRLISADETADSHLRAGIACQLYGGA
jgi:hypothetical protein